MTSIDEKFSILCVIQNVDCLSWPFTLILVMNINHINMNVSPVISRYFLKTISREISNLCQDGPGEPTAPDLYYDNLYKEG